jgi:hypothetical protein
MGNNTATVTPLNNKLDRPAILEALENINKELDAIKKDQQGYGYKFRGINQVLNALSPLCKKYGVIVGRRNLITERSVRSVITVDKQGNEREKQYVETFIKSCDYVFTSTKDGSEFVTQGFGEGQDSSGGDKSASMADSNSYKYTVFGLFNIATEEQKDSDQVTAITKQSDDNEPSRSASSPSKTSFRRKDNLDGGKQNGSL